MAEFGTIFPGKIRLSIARPAEGTFTAGNYFLFKLNFQKLLVLLLLTTLHITLVLFPWPFIYLINTHIVVTMCQFLYFMLLGV